MVALRSLTDITPRLKEQVRLRTIEAARAARAEVERRQGAHPTVTVVDGRRDAPDTQVKPFGRITHHIDTVPLAAAYIRDILRRIAPVDRGNYKNSYVFLVDGERVEDLDSLPPFTKEVIITDTQPYARLIEGMGKTTRRGRVMQRPGLSPQAPNGTLEITATQVKRRFTRIVVEFGYRSLPEIAYERGRDDRWPCIILRSSL